jgi:hypothetical protein
MPRRNRRFGSQLDAQRTQALPAAQQFPPEELL